MKPKPSAFCDELVRTEALIKVGMKFKSDQIYKIVQDNHVDTLEGTAKLLGLILDCVQEEFK